MECVRTLKTESVAGLTDSELSVSGMMLITSRDDGQINSFDVQSGVQGWSVKNGERVSSVSVSGDGRMIVAGTWKPSLEIIIPK